MKPMISVIIPVYNVDKYLSVCFDALLNQSFTNFEVVCVNDGATDNSLNILEQYAKQDNRIKIINQKNQGAAEARNNGLRNAKGDYIFFLDSDDFMHPQALQIVYDMANENDADIVVFQTVKNKGKYTLSNLTEINQDEIKCVITNNPLDYYKSCDFKVSAGVWKLYKASYIKDYYFIKGLIAEDYPWTILLLLQNPKCVLIDAVLYYYTVNPDSITQSPISAQYIKDHYTAMKFIYDNKEVANKKQWDFIVKNVFAKQYKHQLRMIKKADESVKPELIKVFSEQLANLYKIGCVRFKDSKISHYIKYRRLIKKFNK